MDKARLNVGLLLCSSFLTGHGRAETEVAFDDLGVSGSQPRLIAGSNYTWPASVPVTVTDRTIAFGGEVRLGYGSAVPGANYSATVVISSDNATRGSIFEVDGQVVSSVTVAGQPVATPVSTAPNTEKTVVLSIPAATVADGKFELAVINSGAASPNAAVSRVTITSNDPTPLTAAGNLFDPVLIQYTPIPVVTGGQPSWSLSLNGVWKFSPLSPADLSNPGNTASWQNIDVPGQWRNQNFDIPASQATAYFRTFQVPAEWSGRRIKLRFDAVFSTCEVYLNGTFRGNHLGGFTPFELDVTDGVTAGPNTLALRVTSASLADTMASASAYACHPLGGISRDVTLFSVPEPHVKEAIIRTDLDAQYVDAELGVTIEANAATPTGAVIKLIEPAGATVFEESRILSAGSQTFSFPVADPLKWTSETPHLYRLEITMAGTTTAYPVGFREISIVNRELRVNGKPVRLRGVNRHEVDPLRGRSLLPGQWATDVTLFKDANVNLLRTSHYPPALALAEAADEQGMWIELESPFCWENGSSDESHRRATLSQIAEAVKAWRNHPSVLFWSLGNESSWGSNFSQAADIMETLDPTRPRTFNWMNNSVNNQDADKCQIASIHYPGFSGAGQAANNATRPTYLGEDAHLNAYNRREQVTDPGLRDRWSEPFSELWESLWNQPAALGMSIWAGIDDTFFIGDNLTVGYGGWGPVDGWRRKKPEWYHVRKVFSPIHVRNEKSPVVTTSSLTVDVQNRGDFRNFNELVFTWKNGVQSGTITPDLAPGQSGQLVIAPPLGIARFQPVELIVTEPSGREIDRFAFPTGAESVTVVTAAAPQLTENAAAFTVSQGNVTYSLDRGTGAFTWSVNGMAVGASGPKLVLTDLNSEGNTQMTGATLFFTPYTRVATGGVIGATTASTGVNGAVTLTVPCDYTEANGTYTYLFRQNQPVRLTYQFTMKTAVNRRQSGVAFDLPVDYNQLAWKRNAHWTAYPEDHIGRPQGNAIFHYADGKDAIEIGPRERPTAPWSHDNTAYGSNDFRSTKEDIRRVTLNSAATSFEVFAEQDGTHFQAIRLGGLTRASILNHTNAGAERFLAGMASRHYSNLAVGSTLSGSAEFSVGGAGIEAVSASPIIGVPLIRATLRNGNFEQTDVTAATNVSGGSVPSWQTWPGKSTAAHDTGIYDSGMAGSQALYIQGGGAVMNMTGQILAEGQTYRYGFTDVYASPRDASMCLVYQDGTNVIEIPNTRINAVASDAVLTNYAGRFTIPPGLWVGKTVGVGLTMVSGGTTYPEIDDVTLDQVIIPDRFAAWLGDAGYPESDRMAASLRDDDHDGVPSGLEFLSGGTPLSMDANPVRIQNGQGVFEMRDLTPADDIDARLEFSIDLGIWETRAGRVSVAADQSGVSEGFTRYTVDLSGEELLFVRLAADY